MGDLRAPGAILLVSCYELGRQPSGLAGPLAFLERAGFAPAALDTAAETFAEDRAGRARLVAISVPMHTALRLGIHAARRVRALNPGAHLCFFGLYAYLNAEYLRREAGAGTVLGGECEGALVALAEALDRGDAGAAAAAAPADPILERLDFPVPSRGALPPLERYAQVVHADGRRALAGSVEASRGCLHLCRHCPIPPVYEGRFFAVPAAVVLEDARRQIAAGAEHLTFADPDFLNGPGHALKIVRALHAEHPRVTFDFTAKVEHLLAHRALLPELAASGCLFAVSAVESLSDRVLAILDKGHTRADVIEAVRRTREAGIALRPSLVAFTPWTTIADYRDVLDTFEALEVLDAVDPVQWTIRLLVPPGSALLDRPEMRPHIGALDAARLAYEWRHPDPRMDALHGAVTAAVEAMVRRGEPDPLEAFEEVRALARADRRRAPERLARAPRLTESWFC